MAGRPIWYELMTPDPGAVGPFYKALLGWELQGLGTETPTGHPYWMIGRADGGFAGGVLLLTEQMAAAGSKPGWLPYFHVDDVAAAVERAKAAGAQLYMGPMTMSAGTIAMLGDPQGAPFYLMDPTPPAGQPDAKSDVFKPDAVGHCAWNELNTSDADSAIAFYKSLMEWKLESDMPMPGDHTYRFIENDGVQLGAICSMMAPGYVPSWLSYFRVANIAAAQQAIGAHGGTVVHGPQDVPGGDTILVARDPADAWVAFVSKKGAQS